MKKRWKAWLSFVIALVLSVSFSVPVCASSVSGPVQSFTYDIDLSRSDISYVNCNYGTVEYNEIVRPSVASSSDYITSEEWYFHYYDYIGGSIMTSSDVYAYQVRVVFRRSSGTSRHVLWQDIFLDSWNNLESSNVNCILSTDKTDSATFWLVNDYAVTRLYYGLLSYCEHWRTYFSSTTSISDFLSSYSLKGTLELSFTPYTETGYLQAIADNTKETNKQLVNVNTKLNNLHNMTVTETRNQTDAINKNITQETQKQTDTLTNGYDNSGLNSDNDRLASSMDSFDSAESQVTDQSVSYIDSVTFFDPTTHLQLMSCITFTSTFLQNLFVALGDWSVLVMIALSLAFALMLIGWFKYRK